MNITEVIPQDNYMIYIKFDDGKIGLFPEWHKFRS